MLMEIFITRLIESFIFPPGIFLLMMLAGFLIVFFKRGKGFLLIWTGFLLLYLFSTPLLSMTFTHLVETVPALKQFPATEEQKAAIVVLAGGRNGNAVEYSSDVIGCSTLERMRYGAYLHRNTGLPILVTGGMPLNENISLARLMADSYIDDFNIRDVWVEEKSKTTHDHGIYVLPILKERDIDTIYLVTHAYHMRRALRCFEGSGMKIIPAPTAFTTFSPTEKGAALLIPNVRAMHTCVTMLHEIVGSIWYRIRY